MRKNPHFNKKPKILIFLLIVFCALFAGIYALRTVYPLKYYPVIRETADKYGLDVSFVCGVIYTESRFKADALSPKGARGLMQLIETTANWGASEIGLLNYSYAQIFEPEINIELGCWYLSKLLNQYNNDEFLTLAAYNGGSGNVAKWLADEKLSPDGISLSAVPFKETRDFIARVNRNSKIYSYLLRFRDWIYW